MNPVIKTAISIVGSQKKLGDACEVSQQAVYKWLHNKAKVSPSTLAALLAPLEEQSRLTRFALTCRHCSRMPRSQ